MRTPDLLLCVAALSIAACKVNTVDIGREEAAVRAALDRYRGAVEGENIDGLRQSFGVPGSTSWYFTESTAALGDWAAIEPHLRSWFAESDSIRLTYRDVSVYVEPSGHGAWVTYVESGSDRGRNGPGSWTSIRASLGFAKQSGEWRIVQAHFSEPVRGDTAASQ